MPFKFVETVTLAILSTTPYDTIWLLKGYTFNHALLTIVTSVIRTISYKIDQYSQVKTTSTIDTKGRFISMGLTE